MPNRSRDYELELFNVMNALADVEWEMSESEILDELVGDGRDLETEADSVREIFRSAVKEYRQAPLRDAQKRYEQRVSNICKTDFRLPDSASERRALLSAFMTRKPDFGASILTAQHREFKDLTDIDIESYLKQLMELGVIESSPEKEDSEP